MPMDRLTRVSLVPSGNYTDAVAPRLRC
jgi:hypothetical protein